MLAWTFSFLTNCAMAAAVAGPALPGPDRLLWPEACGLVEISPRVWTDAPDRADELLYLAEISRKSVIAFFGDIPPKPGLIFCSSRACADDFGIRGNGLSIADVAVMVAPGGITRGTLTHEMTHSRHHRHMGLRNLVRQPYPTWFDEGLATHVADHPKWSGEVVRTARQRVRIVSRFWQLDDAFRDLGVGLTYRAAAAEVAAIENALGRTGLLEVISRAEAGEPFDDVLTNMLSKN